MNKRSILLIVYLFFFVFSCDFYSREETTIEKKEEVFPSELEVISTRFRPGEILKNEPDSVVIGYNEALEKVKITIANGHSSFPGFTVDLISEAKQIVIQSRDFFSGSNLIFKIEGENSSGKIFTKEVNVDLFQQKKVFAGRVASMQLDKDGKTVWMTALEPNRLYKINSEDLTIEQKIDLPFSPHDVHVSPYDGLVYLTNYDYPEIWVLEYHNLNVVHKIPIFKEPIPFDHPDHPYILPYSVAFSKSGIGLVSFLSDGMSGGKIRIIDASKDYQIRNFEENTERIFESEFVTYNHVVEYVRTSADGNSIFIIPSAGNGNVLHIFDPKTEKVKNEEAPWRVAKGINPFKFHYLKDMFFHLSFLHQYLRLESGETSNNAGFLWSRYIDGDFANGEKDTQVFYILHNRLMVRYDFSKMNYTAVRVNAEHFRKMISLPFDRSFLFAALNEDPNKQGVIQTELIKMPRGWFSQNPLDFRE
ncbi:hypothetical protein MM213_12910 [Belliella sp. R4-6]|uniref:Uncharacterized protein n=1 Tax=Belliella alkalica TaxID=1730871 RepID=A0ABS9VD77_9BACT|nr:hypothetical protein [Belliella alkalica]MCH7414392.1 hypothetical protein [Belliella alkalica]